MSTFDEELLQNPEYQENLQLLNEKSNELLELCMKTEELATLEGCKNASIPNIIELCQDRGTSTMSVCLDSRMNEFSITIDQRIDNARERVEGLEQELEELLQKQEELIQSRLPYLFLVSQFDKEVITDYKQLLRACLRNIEQLKSYPDTSSQGEELMLHEEGKQMLREDVSICISRLTEVKDICEPNDLCSGIEAVENAYKNLDFN